jgi:hydrogenase-4 component D
MSALLLVLLLVPLIGAFVCYWLKGRVSDLLPASLAGLTFVLGMASIVLGYPNSQEFVVGEHWLSWLGNEPETLFGLLIDPLSSLMLIVITVIGLLVVVYSTEYLSSRNKDHAFKKPVSNYYFWMLLFIGSMVGLVISPSFIQLFIFWEMTTICSWALISYTKEDKALFNGFKALIMTHLGGLCFLVALALLFVNAHSFSFNALDSLSSEMRFAVFILLLVAAWAKAAQIPFFTWLPDAMVAPTPVSAYLHAAAMVKAGVYLVARVAVSNTMISDGAGLVLGIMAVVTMVTAVILYFIQDDLKRLLAFSTIGHLGYILFGISLGILGSATGLRGGILHIINHGFAKGLLFLSVGAIAYATGSKSIRELSGLGRRMPLVSAAFIIGFLAVTGVPPLSCFWSKFMIFTGAFQLGGIAGPVLGVIAILESVAAFAWYLFVGHKVFFGEVSEKAAVATADPPMAINVSLIVLMILTLLAPLIGYAFVQYLSVGVFG